MRFYLSLYLFIAGFYLLTASGRIGRTADCTAMFHVAQSLIKEGSLSSEPCDPRDDNAAIGPECVPGKNGRFYTGSGVVSSIAVVPALFGARVLSTVVHLDSELLAKASVSFFTLLVAPLSCVVLGMWILKLGYSRQTAILGACLFAFGSPFWHLSVSSFLSEPYFILALLVAAYLLSNPRSRYDCALAGVAFGVACGARVAGVILFPAYILSLAFQIRARRLPWINLLRDALEFSVPVAICGGLIAWTNYARFGSIFKTGYHIAFPTISFTFSNPLFQGIQGLLFDGEVGLLLFAPWVVLAFLYFPEFLRAHLPESVLCGGVFLINFIFYTKFQQWQGGWVGGPRYLVPSLPFLILVLAPILEAIQSRFPIKENWKFWPLQRASILLLLVAGFLIQAVTLVYPRDRYYADLVFYAHKPIKPWWYGSIPLAALDYWAQTSIPKTEANYSEPARSRAEAAEDSDPLSYWKNAEVIATENDYLNSFHHPENLTLPELMVLKRKLMKLPAKAIYGYLAAVLTIILAGALGLKRYTGSYELRSSAPVGGAVGL